MGKWGINILDNDLALDIKSDYENTLDSGLSHEASTRTLIEQYQDVLDDPEESGVFWFTLATMQLDQNALVKDVKTNSLRLINSNSDSLRWEDEDLRNERKLILEQLKNRLLQG